MARDALLMGFDLERLQKAGLSDARLTEDEHETAFSASGGLDSPAQASQLRIATHERNRLADTLDGEATRTREGHRGTLGGLGGSRGDMGLAGPNDVLVQPAGFGSRLEPQLSLQRIDTQSVLSERVAPAAPALEEPHQSPKAPLPR